MAQFKVTNASTGEPVTGLGGTDYLYVANANGSIGTPEFTEVEDGIYEVDDTNLMKPLSKIRIYSLGNLQVGNVKVESILDGIVTV